jgi:hypothetical protein
MAKYFSSQRTSLLARRSMAGMGILFLLILLMAAQTQIPNVFASPMSTPAPSAPQRGIHLGNHVDAKDWGDDLLRRIDPAKGGTWPDVIVLLSWQVYDRHRNNSCRIDSV